MQKPGIVGLSLRSAGRRAMGGPKIGSANAVGICRKMSNEKCCTKFSRYNYARLLSTIRNCRTPGFSLCNTYRICREKDFILCIIISCNFSQSVIQCIYSQGRQNRPQPELTQLTSAAPLTRTYAHIDGNRQ